MKLDEIVKKYPTPDDFTKAVEEQLLLLAKEHPDFKYNTSGYTVTCRYDGPATIGGEIVGPECKGCIFGQALQNLGWDDKAEMRSGATIDGLVYWLDNQQQLMKWRSIQNEQDTGKTWSEAVSLLSANTSEPN